MLIAMFTAILSTLEKPSLSTLEDNRSGNNNHRFLVGLSEVLSN